MSDVQISIIIPMYNCEKYINRCIDSIIYQGYTKWELILINDGSTDRTKEVIKPYLRNKRIRAYSQDNRGAFCARREGVYKARGRYVLFVDSDDELCNGSLEEIDNNISQYKTDIITYRIKKIDSKDVGIDLPFSQDRVYAGSGYSDVQRYAVSGKWNSLCDKCTRREVLASAYKLYCTDGKMNYGEDWLEVINIVQCAKTLSYINRELYLYHHNQNSNSTTYTSDRFTNLSEVFSRVMAAASSWECTTDAKLAIQHHIFYILRLIANTNHSCSDKYTEYKRISKYIETNNIKYRFGRRIDIKIAFFLLTHKVYRLLDVFLCSHSALRNVIIGSKG